MTIFMRCLCSSYWSSDDRCDRVGGGGEVWKLVEGGDVICDGEAGNGARIKTFYVGHTMGGGG